MLAEFTATWRQRHAQLMLNHKAINSPWVGALASFAVEEPGDVEHLFKQMREAGHEGLVLKRVDSVYSRDRSADWLKKKPLDTTAMRLIDVTGHEKRGANSLICKDTAGQVTHN